MNSGEDSAVSTPDEELPREFQLKRHAKYFEMMSGFLPTVLEEFDSIRMSILFFSISGMDLLGTLDSVKDKDKICDWVYSNLLTDKTVDKSGFRGFNPGAEFSSHGSPSFSPFDTGQLAMTYTALATLLMLGDDLSRVDRGVVVRAVGSLQTSSGSFLSTLEGGECDMRYVYCACCVCYMLDEWSCVDRSKIVEFVKRSVAFDFGIGQGPCLEGHGGSTFCGLASLVLMGELDRSLGTKLKERIRKWCVFRQVTGFHGRPNKRVDTCYSFWIGGSLALLDSVNLISQQELIEYLHSTENGITGGFSKWPDCMADPLHSYMALSGLSLLGHPGLRPVDVPLNMSRVSADKLKALHSQWREPHTT